KSEIANPPPPDVPPLAEAKQNAVVVLIDDEFVSDSGWQAFLGDIGARADTDNIVLPVTLSTNVLALNSPIMDENAVRLHELSPEIRRTALRNRVMHALCRLVGGDEDPVTVFLSHAKLDGVPIAEKVRSFLDSGTGLKNFFDAQDILESTKWADVIRERAGDG